jgi:hypothetical protein
MVRDDLQSGDRVMAYHPVPVDRDPSLVNADAEPARCPYCESLHVSLPRKPSASTYSRCDTCGQLWHPERLPLRGGGGR